jgi:uncharacterized membrane protein AbrB (regulator of aidB expression)
MVFVGSAMGGDVRIISITHAARVLLIVLILPFAFQWFLDYDPAARSSFGAALGELTASDLALLTLCGVAGFLGARALKVPAAAVVGPMILSAGVHLAGWTSAPPPDLLVAAAQVVVGAGIGCPPKWWWAPVSAAASPASVSASSCASSPPPPASPW